MTNSVAISNHENKTIVAYTDGSYSKELGISSYGFIVLSEDRSEELIRSSGVITDPEMNKMRNVAGEITAAYTAAMYAQSIHAGRIIIFHDYTGVSEWAMLKWKRNNTYTQAYARSMNNLIKGGLDIFFVKVKGHSGDKYNDIADELAGGAILLEMKNR